MVIIMRKNMNEPTTLWTHYFLTSFLCPILNRNYCKGRCCHFCHWLSFRLSLLGRRNRWGTSSMIFELLVYFYISKKYVQLVCFDNRSWMSTFFMLIWKPFVKKKCFNIHIPIKVIWMHFVLSTCCFNLHIPIQVKDNAVNLYKYAFPPDLQQPTLAVIGCVQPWGAINPIAELQCRWACQVFKV